jgi:hypothetical protein
MFGWVGTGFGRCSIPHVLWRSVCSIQSKPLSQRRRLDASDFLGFYSQYTSFDAATQPKEKN